MKKPLVLDTHVWVWLMLGDKALSQATLKRIEEAARTGHVLIPVISVWEVAALCSLGRLTLKMPLSRWVQQALLAPGLRLAPLTPDIAVESCELPGTFHKDPADRMIVATARIMNAALVTKDSRIIQYGRAGNVDVVPA